VGKYHSRVRFKYPRSTITYDESSFSKGQIDPDAWSYIYPTDYISSISKRDSNEKFVQSMDIAKIVESYRHAHYPVFQDNDIYSSEAPAALGVSTTISGHPENSSEEIDKIQVDYSTPYQPREFKKFVVATVSVN